MFEQVFWDDYSRPMQNSNPSDSPSGYIHMGFTKAQQLVEENKKPTNIYPLFLQIPAPYHTVPLSLHIPAPNLTVFDKCTSKRLPAHTSWDHTIDLTPGFKPKLYKTYLLLPVEQVELDTFLNENLAKGYIRPSKSPIASPFFFVKKKDEKLCPVQDYPTLSSTREPSRTSTSFRLYLSILTSLRARGSSLKLTCTGATITFKSKTKTSEKTCLRQIMVYLNL